VLSLQPERDGRRRRAPPDFVAIGHDVLYRADGASVAVLAARAPAGAVAGERSERVTLLRRALLALGQPVQVIRDLAPLDPEPSRRRHADAARAEPLPALRRLAATPQAAAATSCSHGRIPDMTLSGFGATIRGMNRTERLYALVEELRARAPRLVRATELARRFEVSTRTVERDLLALQEAGVPIWAQPGPGGGYSLNVEATLPPLNLTPAEAAAIATALAATRAMPFAQAGRSALAKLAGVMAAAPRDSAARLISHIRVAQGPEGAVHPVSEVIQRALMDSLAIQLTYRDAEQRETRRVVEPVGVVGTRRGWYLAAWCRLRDAARAFRLDRILDAGLTAEVVPPRSLDALLQDLPIDVAEPRLM
jgi:predicted DNA-binding transcriptional regulator YafY